MKAIESMGWTMGFVDPTSLYVVRLDGRKFSTFTRGFARPFDMLFAAAMVLTMNDMVNEFHATTGYTHSDEISLVFRPARKDDGDPKDRGEHLFGGRVHKLLSIMAGYCSVRFNVHISTLVRCAPTDVHAPAYTDAFRQKVSEMAQCFDARILVFGGDGDEAPALVDYFHWRSVTDCNRNAIATYGRHFLGKRVTYDEMNCAQVRALLLDHCNIDWHRDVPIFLRHGVYAKKVLRQVTGGPNGTAVANRSRLENRCLIVGRGSGSILAYEKYWCSQQYTPVQMSEVSVTSILDTVLVHNA